MKKLLLSFVLLAGVLLVNAQQDTIRSVIFTEWRGDDMPDAYVEITNMGDEAVDLADFHFHSFGPVTTLIETYYGYTVEGPVDQGTRLSGILDTNESIVLRTMYDAPNRFGKTQNLQRFLDVKSFYAYAEEPNATNFPLIPELEMWGFDSISPPNYPNLLRLWGQYGTALWYCFDNGDSIMVDQVRLAPNLDVTPIKNWDMYGPGGGIDPEGIRKNDVAGVANATDEKILVRKYHIKQGNLDWDDSRGIDAEDSEWMVIPVYNDAFHPLLGAIPSGRWVYPTVGTHGDYSIVLGSSTIDIDNTDSTLSVPWGIYKGDSIMREFTFGDGMAWQYIENPTSFDDSAHTIVQTGDILNIFACGVDLEKISYQITVRDPDKDMALVFPKRSIRYEAIEQDDFNGVMWGWGVGQEPYYVTEGHEVDTVGSVPFATRRDTLYKYLEKAPNAKWEILWDGVENGTERVDLKNGDILRVTSEDGTRVKEYFIDVQEYEPSSNAYLGAITWPEKPEILYDWPGDTIPGFNPTRLSYVVNLPYGTSLVPALSASPQDMNATIDIQRATSLTGGAEERTATFIVTADDDTTIFEYTVLFMIDKPIDLTQVYTGEPFISEMVVRQYFQGNFLEIMNPQGKPLNLEEYLIITSGGRYPDGTKNPAEAVADIVPQDPTGADWLLRYQKAYVPGYKFAGDSTTWKLAPLKLYPDPAVDPWVEPGDVFVIAMAHHKDPKVSPHISEADVIPSPTNWNPWGEAVNNRSLLWLTFTPDLAVYLFKIENDSIFEGTKQLGDIEDLDLVEIWGNPDEVEIFIAGRVLDNSGATQLMRKPHVFEPGKELGAGFGTTEENSDWVMNHSIDEGWNMNRVSENIGVHAMDPPTVHISTVASLVYLVDDGFTGALDIQGDFSGTTVADFLDNIMKSDTGQVLTVMSAGVVKAAGDDIAGDDSLMVVSSNGVNTSYYNLVDQPLDDDALIKVKAAYAGSYSITVDGSTGTITGTGIEWGKPIKDILSALIMPPLSTFNIIDQNDQPVALKVINFDTNLVDVRLSDSIFFEVVAQNGTNIITYQLEPEAMSSDAFVISSVFLVDQDNVNISLIPVGIGVGTFLDNISAVTGATLTILDKYGFARSSGILSIDDKLEVVSEDGSNVVVYYLNFFDEEMPDNNEAPTLSLDITSANVLITDTLTLKATADDDDMPLPTLLTITWEVISGEGVTIVSPDSSETDVTFTKAGAVVLQVTVSDGEMSKTEFVNVGVSTPGNAAPTVTVATASLTAKEEETFSVSATAVDDGNPIGSTLTYTWSVKTGEEANVTIVSPDQLDSDVTISKAGVYTLQIKVTDGELIATEIVVVVVTSTVNIEPVPEPGLLLYPNPVSSILNLELQNTGEVYSTVKLFNITGQAVFNAEIAKSRLQINVRDLDAGLYIITVNSGEYVFTERIQIVK